MTDTTVYNERSWGIDLISEINHYCNQKPRPTIARAAGEEGLKGKTDQPTLFPDILLRDQNQRVLMGWELKFPDTRVTHHDTIKNAIEKSERLNTNSFIIWNVNNAVLYQRIDNDWTTTHNWRLPLTANRNNVKKFRSYWINLLKIILEEITDLVNDRKIRAVDASVTVGQSVYSDILSLALPSQFQSLKEEAQRDREFAAKVHSWAIEATALGKSNSLNAPLELLAQNQIINWINKIIFSHHLKRASEDAFMIDELDQAATVERYVNTFDEISLSTDFKSIFKPILGQTIVSPVLFNLLQQLQAWMKSITAEAGGEFNFSESLASGLAHFQGKASGQYATPKLLARFLVGLTIRYPHSNAIDPCMGTGTIAKEILKLKMDNGMSAAEATKTIWGADKFSIPLGFAGIALADPSALGEIQQIFRSDVAAIRTGSTVKFTDPITGGRIIEQIPQFAAVVSNLPFVQFEDIAKTQDKQKMLEFAGIHRTALQKADLYSYILLGLKSLITENGRIGVIISNSWLGTSWGKSLQELLLTEYNVRFIISSSNGRWFNNASVVTTLLVLEKPLPCANTTVVATTKKPIEDWSEEDVDTATNLLLSLDQASVGEDAFISYCGISKQWLEQATHLGVSWTCGLKNPNLIPDISETMILASNYLKFERGSRTGWDDMFFISKETANHASIEADYLSPVMHNPKIVLKNAPLTGLQTNMLLFSCSRSVDELERLNHSGALQWINKFSHEVNRKGIPLPKTLKGQPFWYSASKISWGDYLMQINPDSTFGVYRPGSNALSISQRFISIRASKSFDKRFMHALLNSTLTHLWQELTGFARGEGVLDRSMTSLKNYLRIPNPSKFSDLQADSIVTAFEPLAKRPPLPITQELQMEDRLTFDSVVFDALGIFEYQEDIYSLLSDLVASRRSV